ncbi:hypothetical protein CHINAEXTREME_11570 [Halobiforma lacisalsi AJ5]|uniref:DUF485 domain-containing protein n=1 Tax=Natronobacterium lacisalsi AJ5 TaxID=358396 RepID=M0L382_NATLA|nr:hypothetical protein CHINAEXTREME_11570 [Halobiforma lacisalsi AJ5]EMA27991.1 hypothetical protein C445_20117 [Halobiforma lacisalsi AJ5]
MTNEKSRPTQNEIERRIQQVGGYSRAVRVGYLVILCAFLLAVVGILPANLDSVSQAIDSILLPLIFAGLGLILYGIGMHLHLMHLNLIRQLQPNTDDGTHSPEEELE